METTLILAPLLFSTVWSVFILSKNLVVSLVTLLITSFMMPLTFMEFYKLFWPCGLLLILVSTGLIVIFAYIVSLHPKEESFKVSLSSVCLLGGVTTLLSSYDMSSTKIFYTQWLINVDLCLSLSLFSLLLFLVVSFIRIIYSKGGGFRKKF